MWNKIFDINIKVRLGEITASESADKILSLMGEKEVGGSGALPSNGDLHGVRDSHASELEVTEEVRSNGSLEKRTDTENLCLNCGDDVYVKSNLCLECRDLAALD